MADFLIFDDARPAEFWTLLGPHFASEKLRREMPFLSDRAGRLWVVSAAGQSDCVVAAKSFASADVGEDAVLREVFAEPGADAAGVEAALTALQYLFSTGSLRVRATAKGRAVALLTAAGFNIAGTKGAYTLMEVRP